MPSPSEVVAHLLEADTPVDPRDFILQTGEQDAQDVNLNFQNAQTASRFYHKTAVYADRRRPIEARRNGKTQLWKSRPGIFRIPIKVGYKEYGQIDNYFYNNADEWQVVPPEHPEPMPRIQIRF